jgi:hypothetical protein
VDLRIKKFNKLCREIEFVFKTLQIFLLSKKQATAQRGFYSTFEEQLSHIHPLYILANKINWEIFEESLCTTIFR